MEFETNLQTVFDKVAVHLLTQNQKAVHLLPAGRAATCRYRTKHGLKCAAGCLIPDEDYDPNFENHRVEAGETKVGEYFNSKYSPDCVNLIVNLQIVHDNHDTSNWLARLYQVADEFDLNTEHLSRF